MKQDSGDITWSIVKAIIILWIIGIVITIIFYGAIFITARLRKSSPPNNETMNPEQTNLQQRNRSKAR